MEAAILACSGSVPGGAAGRGRSGGGLGAALAADPADPRSGGTTRGDEDAGTVALPSGAVVGATGMLGADDAATVASVCGRTAWAQPPAEATASRSASSTPARHDRESRRVALSQLDMGPTYQPATALARNHFEPAPSPTGAEIAHVTIKLTDSGTDRALDNYDIWTTSLSNRDIHCPDGGCQVQCGNRSHCEVDCGSGAATTSQCYDGGVLEGHTGNCSIGGCVR